MIRFYEDELIKFLTIVKKYMAIRGDLSQKDLSDALQVGTSTLSRFFNMKTKDIDERLIASLVAFLNIPIHEMIDFVENESTEPFRGLVAFYRKQFEDMKEYIETPRQASDETTSNSAQASIRGIKMPFGGENQREQRESESNASIKDKLSSLSPRQKGFLTDFLDLDPQGKDLVVDIGNAVFQYFKQSKVEFKL